MASEEPCESNSSLPSLRKLHIGMPSITYRAFDDCSMDFEPRITTFDEPPTPDDEALMFRPATLPLSELTKLTSFTATMSSALICWALYESAFSERLMPRAVTTTDSISDAASRSVMSNEVRLPTATACGS